MQVLVNLPENVLSFIYEHGFVNADDRNTVNHALLECIELPEGYDKRCKDCSHWAYNENNSFLNGYCASLDCETGETFYCADFERKKDNGYRRNDT